MKNLFKAILLVTAVITSEQALAQRACNKPKCKQEREHKDRGLVSTLVSPATDTFDPVTRPVEWTANGVDDLLPPYGKNHVRDLD